MEMSGQFYTPAALYLEKKLLVLIEWEDEWASELLLDTCEEYTCCCQELKPQIVLLLA